MPFATEAFGTLGEVTSKDGRLITSADVHDADILAIRSTTNAGPALLGHSRVRFVGTATIGTDHMDIPWMEENGIRWCYAPGCNANSVSEYITAALLHLAVKHGFVLAGRTVGIVGVGNVGTRVAAKARALGLKVILCDPPRARGEGKGRNGEDGRPLSFRPLEEVLASSDIVTMHVPLTRSGPDATVGMANAEFFKTMKHGAIFINSARGGAMVSDALIAALASGKVSHTVIDTWENEPGTDTELLARADIGTPHIAGHSYDGKVAGTVMVYREACSFLKVEPGWTPDALLPPPNVPHVTLDAAGKTDDQATWELVRKVYDITTDDAALRATPADPSANAKHFDLLRKKYPVRREFPFTTVTLRNASVSLANRIADLRFRVIS